MNITVFATGDSIFTNCDCIKGYTFKMVAPRGKSTLLTGGFTYLQDRSALSTVLNASRHKYIS